MAGKLKNYNPEQQIMHNEYRILCFGDSLTEGYHSFGTQFYPYTIKLKNLFRSGGHHVIIENHGISGDKTVSMVHRFKRVISESSFNAAIILGGTNDLQYPATQTFGNLKAMHEAASHLGITTFAVTVPELNAEKTYKDLSVTRNSINDQLKEYCAANSIPVIDLAVLIPFHSLSPTERNKIWDDGVHFTEHGYDLLGELIYNHVKNIFD